MEDKIRMQAQQSNHQASSRWKGLQVRMTLSYIAVTIGMVLFLQIIHSLVILFVKPLSLTWNQMMLPDAVVFSLIAGLFGILSTRGIIMRLHRIAAATTSFAIGQYEQRLPATAADEIGQLEAHFNQMAEQLASHTAREKILVEQNARLEERTRLSRDLHDSVKQQIFALAVQVELARLLLGQDSAEAEEHLNFADELSYQVQLELTTLIDALRPADLQAKGLITALRDYVTTWSRQCNITATLSLPQSCSLPALIEEALWRVTQEALSNIARHSHASTMHLHLERSEQHVTLTISDNGQGFEANSQQHKGVGLHSMCSRIEQVGGTTQIQSGKGVGTRIVIHCPLLPLCEEGQAESQVRA